jgi:hypothetical protein
MCVDVWADQRTTIKRLESEVVELQRDRDADVARHIISRLLRAAGLAPLPEGPIDGAQIDQACFQMQNHRQAWDAKHLPVCNDWSRTNTWLPRER